MRQVSDYWNSHVSLANTIQPGPGAGRRRTKLSHSGLLKYRICGTMSRGRCCPGARFATGMRGRTPRNAIPVKVQVMMAQIRRVQRRPTLSRSVVSISGNTKPRRTGLLHQLRVFSVAGAVTRGVLFVLRTFEHAMTYRQLQSQRR